MGLDSEKIFNPEGINPLQNPCVSYLEATQRNTGCTRGINAVFLDSLKSDSKNNVPTSNVCYDENTQAGQKKFLWFHLNFQEDDSSIEDNVTGWGGALYAITGNILIDACEFIGNDAKAYGGALMLLQNTQTAVWNSLLVSSGEASSELDGTLIASYGVLELVNVRMEQLFLTSDFYSVIYHEGSSFQATAFLFDFSVQCPQNGYLLTKYLSPGIMKRSQDVIDKRQKGFKVFRYVMINCAPCEKDTYSMSGAYLYHNISNSSGSADGEIAIHSVTCFKCPFQGHCVSDGVHPKKNQWGMVIDNQVVFYKCPAAYCCPNTTCSVPYNYCVFNRVGTLCGRCSENHTEDVFSTGCTPSSECGDIGTFVRNLLYLSLAFSALLLGYGDLHRWVFHSSKQKTKRTVCSTQDNDHSIEETTENDTTSTTSDNPQTTRQHPNVTPISTTRKRLTRSNYKKLELNKGKTDTPDHEGYKDHSSAFLLLFLFYIQDSSILHAAFENSAIENASLTRIKETLQGFFLFKLSIFYHKQSACFSLASTPVSKALLLTSTQLAAFSGLLILKILVAILSHTGMKRKRKCAKNIMNSFDQRISVAFIISLLLTHQRITLMLMPLVTCLQVHNEQVLQIDGHLQCHQDWQTALVVSFILGLMALPVFFLLITNYSPRLSSARFYLGCVLPLPLVLFLIGSDCCCRKRPAAVPRPMSVACPHTWNVLQGSQRPMAVNIGNWLFAICWTGVDMTKRLLLVVVYVTVQDELTKVG